MDLFELCLQFVRSKDMMQAATLALLVQGRQTSVAGGGTALYDSFTTYNNSVWSYADGSMGTTDGCKVW